MTRVSFIDKRFHNPIVEQTIKKRVRNFFGILHTGKYSISCLLYLLNLHSNLVYFLCTITCCMFCLFANRIANQYLVVLFNEFTLSQFFQILIKVSFWYIFFFCFFDIFFDVLYFFYTQIIEEVLKIKIYCIAFWLVS